MNGLLSRAPSPGAIRPLIGATLFAGVEAGLVLLSEMVPALLRFGAAGALLILLAALVTGIRGDDAPANQRKEP